MPSSKQSRRALSVSGASAASRIPARPARCSGRSTAPSQWASAPEVEFTSASGSNTARSIATQEPYTCSNGTFLNRAVGTVGAFPAGLIGTWQIGGVSYAATSSTSFQQRTPFAIGSCAKVAYFVLNGVNLAQEIESEGADDCTSAPPAAPNDLRKLYAPIETLPASPFIGPWRIGGVDFAATAATGFEQASAPFAVGVCVEAKYVIDGSVNQLVAVESNRSRAVRSGASPPCAPMARSAASPLVCLARGSLAA